MNKSYTVRDYMRSEVITVPLKATVGEALRIMIEGKTNGLIVIDDKSVNSIKGILTTLDIIKYIVPDYLEEDRKLALFESGDIFTTRAKEVASHPIAKIMTQSVKTIKASHTLIEAAALLTELQVRQLPVVNEDGELVGHINRTDIKRAMGDVLNKN